MELQAPAERHACPTRTVNPKTQLLAMELAHCLLVQLLKKSSHALFVILDLLLLSGPLATLALAADDGVERV
jgi:hypothetical protein